MLNIILPVWNMFVFILYGTDKKRAEQGMWRISEKTLILCAFCMGGFGALCGMRFFRHKTKKNFKILVPMALLLNIAVIFFAKRSGIWTE